MSRQRSSKRVATVAGVLFGAIFLVGYLVYLLSDFVGHQRFAQNHESTLGTVVDNHYACQPPGPCVSWTMISFLTKDGRSMQFDVYYESGSIGESVTVYYNPDDPEYAQLTEGGWPAGEQLLATVVVMLLLFAGIWLIGLVRAMFTARRRSVSARSR